MHGSSDGFITIVNAAGTAWQYSSFFGGVTADYATGIALDHGGNIYLTGSTSGQFPTTAGAAQPSYGMGAADAFVAKFTASGTSLIYSTYLGGLGNDGYLHGTNNLQGGKIAVNEEGSAYVVGSTTDVSNFPLVHPLPLAYQGSFDIFITQVSPDGGAFFFSTLLGGKGTDRSFSIALDSLNQIYVAGDTNSSENDPPGFPTVNPYQSSNQGGFDAVIAKITPDTVVCSNEEALGAAASCAVRFAGQGVNTLTGNFWYPTTDLSVPAGRGLGLNFSRSYNSLATTVGRGSDLIGPLGPGWTHTYNLFIDRDSTYNWVHLADGSMLPFPINGTAPNRFQATLTHANGQYTLTTTHGQLQYVFYEDGSLLSIRDRNGYVTLVGYEPMTLRLYSVQEDTRAGGRYLIFGYTYPTEAPTQQLIKEVFLKADGANTRAIRFDYTTNYATSVTDWHNFTTQFNYNSKRQLESIGDANHPALVTHYHTTPLMANRVSDQRDPDEHLTMFDYPQPSQTAKVTDPRQLVTQYNYELRWLTSVIRNPGSLDPSKPPATWSYTYSTIFPTGVETMTDPTRTHTWRTVWDAQGNIQDTYDPLQNHTGYKYNTDNTLREVDPPAGSPLIYTYAGNGNLATSSRFWAEKGETLVTHYYYEHAGYPGEVSSLTDPLNHTWTFGYDNWGYRSSVTSPAPVSHTTTSEYNMWGRVVKVTTNSGYHTTYVYGDGVDTPGVTITATVKEDPLHAVTVQHYNGHGQLEWALNPPNNTENTTPTQYYYTAGGALDHIVLPDHNLRRFCYDANNNLTAVVNEDRSFTNWHYNSFNQVDLQIIPSQSEGTDWRTFYDYDAGGNLHLQSGPFVLLPLQGPACPVDNPRTSVPPGGATITYNYYDNNALQDVLYSDPGTPKVHYDYSPTGARLHMMEGASPIITTTTYSNDTIDQLTKISRQPPTGSPTVVSYDYDERGSRTKLTYPNKQILTLHYDAANRPDYMDSSPGGHFTFGYDGDDRLHQLGYPNQISTTFTPDAANRLLQINNSSLSSLDYTYTYYQSGDLATSLPGGGTLSTYTYDVRDSLYQETGPRSVTWGLSPGSNPINRQENGQADQDTITYGNNTWPQERTVQHNGQLTEDVSFTYDGNGNRQVEHSTLPANTRQYTFDQRNRLTVFTKSAGTTSYGYDGDGLRISKQTCTGPGCTTNYTWDTAAGLPLLLTDGQANYIYSPGGQILLAVPLNGSPLRYYHADRQGNIVGVTNAGGGLVTQYQYDPYGERTLLSGTEDPFGYGGQYRDSESGLIYLRVRYYDPVTRQFLTRDPLDQTRPVAYTDGNPLNHGDPTGLCTNPQDCIGEQAAAAGAERTSGGQGGGTNPNAGVGAVAEGEESALILGGVYNSPEAAAIEAADAAQQLRPRPTTAGALRVGNRVFPGVNVKGGQPLILPPEITSVLDEVPLSERLGWHGRCAEPQCLALALEAGVDPAGGTIATRTVRAAGSANHNLPYPACPSCQYLLRHFGVTDLYEGYPLP